MDETAIGDLIFLLALLGLWTANIILFVVILLDEDKRDKI